MATLADVSNKIDTHVDVCEIRYQAIAEQTRGVNARLKRLEGILIGGGGAIILLLLELVLNKH